MSGPSFAGSETADLRFQYDVIKNLAESVREQSRVMAGIQSTQMTMLERLAKIESNRVNEDVAKLDVKVSHIAERTDKLEADKDRRDGAYSAFDWIRVWGPALFSLAVVLYLGGRAAGLIPSPPVTPARVEATIHPEDRRIEGTVGGKP
jgi:uncharacterized coiled-coil protein SlyX